MGRDNKSLSRLRIERFTRGITLRELADATGRSRMFFSRLETGGSAILTPELAEKVSETLGVRPADLFDEAPE